MEMVLFFQRRLFIFIHSSFSTEKWKVEREILLDGNPLRESGVCWGGVGVYSNSSVMGCFLCLASFKFARFKTHLNTLGEESPGVIHQLLFLSRFHINIDSAETISKVYVFSQETNSFNATQRSSTPCSCLIHNGFLVSSPHDKILPQCFCPQGSGLFGVYVTRSVLSAFCHCPNFWSPYITIATPKAYLPRLLSGLAPVRYSLILHDKEIFF